MEASAEGTSYVTQQQMKSMQEDLTNSLMQKFEKLLLNQMAQLEQKKVLQELVKAPQNPENELTDQEKQGKDEIEITSNLLVQFRKEILKLEEDLSDIDSENLLILENKKNSWEKKIINIKAIHRDLVINHSTKEDIDKELETIEKQHADALNKLLIKISEKQEEKKTVALEAVKIPYFSGDIEEWSSFHNMFHQFVHMSKLPPVEKLLRLKTHVKGEALRIIQNLQITENNYDAAWEILNQRYGNKRILFTKLVDKILDQPNININSASNLRQLLNTTNESIQALKAMNIRLEDADPILARIVIRKLDKEGLVLYEQNTKKSKEIQRLKDVMQFLEVQCEALEASSSKKYGNNEINRKLKNRFTML